LFIRHGRSILDFLRPKIAYGLLLALPAAAHTVADRSLPACTVTENNSCPSLIKVYSLLDPVQVFSARIPAFSGLGGKMRGQSASCRHCARKNRTNRRSRPNKTPPLAWAAFSCESASARATAVSRESFCSRPATGAKRRNLLRSPPPLPQRESGLPPRAAWGP